MSRRSAFWTLATASFVILNLLGAGFALAGGEMRHAAVHLALFVPATLVLWNLLSTRHGPRRAAPDARYRGAEGAFGAHLSNLERSLDAVALEVERIGESQRFMTRTFAERRPAEAADAERTRRSGARPGDG